MEFTIISHRQTFRFDVQPQSGGIFVVKVIPDYIKLRSCEMYEGQLTELRSKVVPFSVFEQ